MNYNNSNQQKLTHSMAKYKLIPALTILFTSGFFTLSSANSPEATTTAQAQLDIRETRREIRKVMRAASKTAAQAERGGEIFKTTCASCHSDMALKTFSPSVDNITNAIHDLSIDDHTAFRTQQTPEIIITNIHDIATYL